MSLVPNTVNKANLHWLKNLSGHCLNMLQHWSFGKAPTPFCPYRFQVQPSICPASYSSWTFLKLQVPLWCDTTVWLPELPSNGCYKRWSQLENGWLSLSSVEIAAAKSTFFLKSAQPIKSPMSTCGGHFSFAPQFLRDINLGLWTGKSLPWMDKWVVSW